ncbi:MAG: (d)CMP kinase [Desulfitobacteriaceae bacterium]
MGEENEGRWQIAIDGPAGAGKSTVAREVAKRLGILYLDTGAMYRVIAYKVLAREIPLTEEETVSAVARDTEISFSSEQRVWCDGKEITQAIRTPEVSRAVSVIAAYPEVRKRLVELQRAEAKMGGVVMDGRDIGTHVLPNADLKIFLTADPQERARRRWLELQSTGKKVGLSEVTRDLEERDHRDAEREAAPLEAAPDALILDTTGLSVEEIVVKITAIIREDVR